MPQLPKLSHGQFVVLSVLMGSTASGRDIRKRLTQFGVRQGGPAFYQLMARMEDANLVLGWYEQKIVKAQIIRERHYRITAVGRRAWNDARQFYARAGGLMPPAKGLAYE
jgi:DNA-binding PadR family transcriptional regulator